jgi:hypothetical protein
MKIWLVSARGRRRNVRWDLAETRWLLPAGRYTASFVITPVTHSFRPGESPFHVRGSTYHGMREFVERRVTGGLDAVLPHLPDDEHRSFAAQIFLPTSQYDALPIRPISEAIAAAQGLPYYESVRSRGSLVAQRDLGGLYRILLKVVSPELVAERLQRVSLRYFDFGAVEVVDTSKGRSETRMKGIPLPIAMWIGPMITGYATEALKAAGASAPRVRVDAPVRDGERSGVETVMLGIHLSWS